MENVQESARELSSIAERMQDASSESAESLKELRKSSENMDSAQSLRNVSNSLTDEIGFFK